MTAEPTTWTAAAFAEQIWQSRSLKGHVRFVALTLAHLCDEDSTNVDADLDQLARFAGVSRRTVTDALDTLEAHGWIEREHDCYWLLDEADQ